MFCRDFAMQSVGFNKKRKTGISGHDSPDNYLIFTFG